MTTRSSRTLATGFVMFLSACSGGGDGATSTTSPTSSVPVSVTKQAGDAQTGTVGATIAAPVVKVLNFAGSGVAGIAVTFTATGGDVLGATTATTGADGAASAGSWRLGTVAGVHTVSAAAAGVTLPASFSATANADVAKTMAKSAGDNQTGFAGANVTTPPAVTIADQYGNPVTGTAVTFSIATGGGSLTAPTPTSNANGVAAVGAWRLGAAPAPNTLVATATGLPSVTFTATGISDPCSTFIPVAIGQTLNGTLASLDCLFADDYYADLYAFSTTAGQAVQLDMVSTVFNPWIDLGSQTNEDAYYAYNNDGGGGTSARIRLLAPAGQYLALANSFDERATGAYTFGLSTWTGDIGNCETDAWIIPSAAPYAQNLATTDCLNPITGGNQYYDGVLFISEPGRTYTITMSSTAIDPTLTLRALAGQAFATVATDDNSGGGTTARITWTPTTATLAVILAAGVAPGTTGAYSLSFTATGTAASLRSPTTLPLGRGRAIRRPASAGAGVPWAFQPGPAQTTVRGAPRP